MKLNDTTIIPFPTKDVFGEMYAKFAAPLVSQLKRTCNSEADCEDAVAEAFVKLMYHKKPEAYGDNLPETEKSWFWTFYWQARSYLSHLKERFAVHAKYVEYVAKVMEDVFACGHQGEAIDEDLNHRALVRALKTLQAEFGISRRNLEIYVWRTAYERPAKEVAVMYGTTANNVDQITWRVGRIVRKHGPRHFEAALRHEGHEPFALASA